MMCGGMNPTSNNADDKTRDIAEKIRQSVEEKHNNGASYEKFDLHSYKTQLVAGTNYFMKIEVGEKKFIHVKVNEALPCYGSNLEVIGHAADKSETDAIDFI